MSPPVPTAGWPSTCQMASGWTHAIAASISPAPKAAKSRCTALPGSVMACLQYGSERRDRVQRGGKARIERHLNDSLDDFLARRADIEPGGEIYFQLWQGIPHDRHRGPSRKCASLQVATESSAHVAHPN